MNDKLNNFKTLLHNGMIHNFKKDGYLVPIFFYMENDIPYLTKIPFDCFSSNENKEKLAQIIKNKCLEPNVVAAGIITEANGVSVVDDNLIDLIDSGDVSISEMKEKKDLIIMIFSTPENHEIIADVVDVKNKEIIGTYSDFDSQQISGKFNNFFNGKIINKIKH